MSLQEYIQEEHEGREQWFLEEVSSVQNYQRVKQIHNLKDYLDGKHKIANKKPEMWNGEEFHPRRMVLQIAKTILNYQSAFLLQNPVTITGEEDIVQRFQRINKKGQYDQINHRILDKVLKYGKVAEYVYLDDKRKIQSKLFDPADSYYVYNHENTLVAFIEAFNADGVDHYTIISEDTVEKWNNRGGKLKKVKEYSNVSGLPIVYHNQNELSEVEGKSDLEDIIPIIDEIEELINRYFDAFQKFVSPIPVLIGQQLKGKNQALPKDVAGGGVNLEEFGDMKMLSNQLDFQSFQALHETLMSSLLDVSATPAVSMNKTDISNLSEVSIKLLFQLASVKASINEMFMRSGIYERFEKFRNILELQGETFSDEEFESLDIVFQHNMPSNDSEVIDNLETLKNIQGISMESILEHSPYTTDVQRELQKIQGETSESGSEDDTTNSDEDSIE
ncbi:phage portal protein [Salibacterium lacus]|uniref:Phage portal protein n=1 Tax=Salibacterium lacus TaxID=1898109 RepID=A0ABW5SW49_9BACI